MREPVATYLDAIRELQRIADRCDGLIADVTGRHDALLAWQRCIVDGAPDDAIETALRDFFQGEPPGWAVVRTALGDWITATHIVAITWNALSTDERAGLVPPRIRLQPDALDV